MLTDLSAQIERGQGLDPIVDGRVGDRGECHREARKREVQDKAVYIAPPIAPAANSTPIIPAAFALPV